MEGDGLINTEETESSKAVTDPERLESSKVVTDPERMDSPKAKADTESSTTERIITQLSPENDTNIFLIKITDDLEDEDVYKQYKT